MKYLLVVITLTLMTHATDWNNISLPDTVHQCKLTHIGDTISNEKIRTIRNEPITVAMGSEKTLDYNGRMIVINRVSDIPSALIFKGDGIFVYIDWRREDMCNAGNTVDSRIIIKDGIRKNHYDCKATSDTLPKQLLPIVKEHEMVGY